jgi:hypothetical protein
MTDGNDARAREIAQGLIQGYIGPDPSDRHEGALRGACAGSERGTA